MKEKILLTTIRMLCIKKSLNLFKTLLSLLYKLKDLQEQRQIMQQGFFYYNSIKNILYNS